MTVTQGEGRALDGILPEEKDGYDRYRALVEGTNISRQTLLATDYLNHFNEIVMLLGMLPDMPEMIDECKAWQPKSYTQHFADSSFTDKNLAIEAYARVPSRYRMPFEETISQLNTLVMGSIQRLEADIGANIEPEILQQTCTAIARAAQALMDCASAIIHGSDHVMAQAEIDSLLKC